INGRPHSHNALLDLDKWTYWLSAAIVQGIPRNPVLMFSTTTPDWYFFDRAADVQGNDLPVIKGGRSVQMGSVQETFGIQLTPKYLADHRTTGFNLKIIGDRGSRIVEVPAEVVAAFEETYLAEVEKAGGFREDLAAAQAIVTPTPQQMGQVAAAGAAEMAAKGGFGISFAMIPQGLVLLAVAPGSRAERAKLKSGQLVLVINGKSTAGMSQLEATDLLRASVGATTFTVAGIGDLIIAP
ncbi:MAG: PDZ domain-containing protein, partial [Betaproteobacteria bacterium]